MFFSISGSDDDPEEVALLPLTPDPAAAAEAFNTAAEEASAAFKGKLAQRWVYLATAVLFQGTFVRGLE